MDNGNGGSERAGPPSGGLVRSIRKNIVLPGSGPTDLHYGKNGYVPRASRAESDSESAAALSAAGPAALAAETHIILRSSSRHRSYIITVDSEAGCRTVTVTVTVTQRRPRAIQPVRARDGARTVTRDSGRWSHYVSASDSELAGPAIMIAMVY